MGNLPVPQLQQEVYRLMRAGTLIDIDIMRRVISGNIGAGSNNHHRNLQGRSIQGVCDLVEGSDHDHTVNALVNQMAQGFGGGMNVIIFHRGYRYEIALGPGRRLDTEHRGLRSEELTADSQDADSA